MSEIDIPEELVEAVYRDNCIIFLGSGVSKNVANLPNWNSLVGELEELLTEEGIDVKNQSKLELLDIFEEQFSRDELLSELSQALEYDTEEADWSILEDIKELNPHVIFTTNYDTIIEDYLDKESIDYYKTGLDFGLENWNPPELLLVKLHGDIDNLRDGIVISEEDYAIYHLKFPRIYSFIMDQVQDKKVLYIGFSFEDSNFRRLYHQLRWSSRDIRSGKRRMEESYTITYSPTNTKSTKLNMMDITPIEVSSYEDIASAVKEVRTKTSEYEKSDADLRTFDGVDDQIVLETPFLNGLSNFSIRSKILTPSGVTHERALFSLTESEHILGSQSKLITRFSEKCGSLYLKIFLYNPLSGEFFSFDGPPVEPDEWCNVRVDITNDELRLSVDDREKIHPLTQDFSTEFNRLCVGSESGDRCFYKGKMRYFRLYDYNQLKYLIDFETREDGEIYHKRGGGTLIGI